MTVFQTTFDINVIENFDLITFHNVTKNYNKGSVSWKLVFSAFPASLFILGLGIAFILLNPIFFTPRGG